METIVVYLVWKHSNALTWLLGGLCYYKKKLNVQKDHSEKSIVSGKLNCEYRKQACQATKD